MSSILSERGDHVATVTLNRPDKLNALDRDSWAELGAVFRALAGDDDVYCVVVRGAGDRAFAAGSDIAGFAHHRTGRDAVRAYGEIIHETLAAVVECPHPVVSMIRGACVGGGLEIACASDLRICAASSRFGAPINRLGLTMAHAELRVLVSAVGDANAREILLEGAIFDAERAAVMGVVTRVVPDEALEREVEATVARIVAGAPLVNRWHKKFLRRLTDPAPLTPEEIEEAYDAFDTSDYRIGQAAFLNKEAPRFTGR